MKQTLKLAGLHDIDVSKTPDNGLSFIDLYFSGACSLNCLYCFTNHEKGRLTTKDRKKLLDESKNLGAQTLVSTGAGEPLLDKGFKEVIRHAYNLRMKSVIYTNGQHIDNKMAEFLFNHGVSPLLKLESLDSKIHDAITKKEGSHKKTLSAIENLIGVGYGKVNSNNVTRTGIASVYTALNIDSLPELKKFCEDRGILLTIDELGLEKRAYKNRKSLFVPKSKINKVKKNLQIIESGIFHDSCLNIPQVTCLYSEYGIRIDQDGNVSYCTMQDTGNIIGNVLEIGLKQAVANVKIANLVAKREKIKTLQQVNDALEQENLLYKVEIPQNTCIFKAGNNLKITQKRKNG